MPRGKQETAEQIIPKLRVVEVEVARGKTVAESVKKIGVTEQTYYRWKKKFGGLRVDQAKRLKELEKEDSRLKRLLADAELDNAILREVAGLSQPRTSQPSPNACDAGSCAGSACSGSSTLTWPPTCSLERTVVFRWTQASGSRSLTAMCPAIFRVWNTSCDTAPGRPLRWSGSPSGVVGMAASPTSAMCCPDTRRPTGSARGAGASPRDRAPTASSNSHRLRPSTGSRIWSRRRGSAGTLSRGVRPESQAQVRRHGAGDRECRQVARCRDR